VIAAIVGGGTDESPSDTTVGAGATSTSTADSTSTAAQSATTTSEPLSTTSTEPPTTTTTEPATTTTEVPIIGSGVWEIGTDVQPGVYRVSGYWARLDEALEIVDTDLVSDADAGFTLVNILDTDAYIEVNGGMVHIDDLPVIDPIAQGFTEGTYLVNVDITPGRYRVNPVNGTAYWARLTETRDIIDNDLSEGQLVVIVDESDWALTYTGMLEPFPEG
jgi:hypothetical protein